jgi:hypothetical protein
MTTLRDDDPYSWSMEQAAVLRRGAELRLKAPDGIDWRGIAEEIELVGTSLERELYSRYRVLLVHLLKWRHQPGHRGGSWRSSIREQRDEIARLLKKNPGMRPKREAEFIDAYAKARERAADETGLPLAVFPAECPFTLDQVEDDAFWPEAADLRAP